MMGLGHMGSGFGGNSSFSTSNLSALAPPFTVDRLNPIPNSNPPMHYPDSSYMVEPFSHAWQYARPSAPGHELVIDSPGGTTVPLSDGYRFSASDSISPSNTYWSAPMPGTKTSGSAFAYGGEVKPYYSSYVPPLVEEDSLLVRDEGSCYNAVPTSGLSGTSQLDYSQSSFDLEYGPRYVESSGFDNGKQDKRVELDGSFFSDKANIVASHGHNQLNQGGCSTGTWDKPKDDYAFSYPKFNPVSEREFHTGSSGVGRVEDKCIEQNLGFFTYDSNKMHVPESSSTYPGSHLSGLSFDLHENFLNNQRSCSSYEKCFSSTDAPFIGPFSVERSSPTVVIRPPPSTSGDLGQNIASCNPAHSDSGGGIHIMDFDHSNPSKQKDSGLEPSSKMKEASFGRLSPTVVIRPPPATSGDLGQNIASCNPAHSDTGGDINIMDFDHSNPSKQKDSGLRPSSKIKEASFETKLLDFSEQGHDLISSSSVKELSGPLHSTGSFDYKIKAGFASQMLETGVSGCFPMASDNVQLVKPTDASSDLIDAHNSGVDSPCWKGAPYSKFSPFDVEAGNSVKAEKDLGECYRFDHTEHLNPHSKINSSRAMCEKNSKGNQNNNNECASNGAPKIERTLDTICSSNKRVLLDDAKCRVSISTTSRCKGAEIGGDTDMQRKESGLPNNLTGGFDKKGCDTKHLIDEEDVKITPIDVSEVSAVAVHAAERVLASPASQDDATEHPKLPDPKLNVPTVVKAMLSLSELLMFHLSNNEYSLEDENTEMLKHVISNLDSCLSKKIIQASNKPEPNSHVGNTSEKLEESCDVGTSSESPHVTNKAESSCIKLDSWGVHKEEGSYIFSGKSGKKDKKSLKSSPIRDDLDMTRDDDMAKAIEKVLEENFHFNEEMHSQAVLFKSLWLEAEAKLCSISYKARFDRMKILMEEAKLKAPQATASHLSPKACDSTIPKSASQNFSILRTSGQVDDVEASVMKRFNILKSREENLKPVNVEEQRPEMVDGEHAGSIMARFGILKSLEGNSKSISMEEEQQPEMLDWEFAGGKYVMPFIRGQSGNEALNVALKPHFPHQIGSLGEGKFGSFVEGAAYESPSEFHLSAAKDPVINSFNNNMTSQNKLGRHDSSSDWEHVLKDDFSWQK